MRPPLAIPLLSSAEWKRQRDAHLERATQHTRPARERRDRGIPHPIADFLFRYYPFPFSLLETWVPGIGVALQVPEENLDDIAPLLAKGHAFQDGRLFADPRTLTDKERARLAWIRELLTATRDRPPHFACHGLHEWAMVYRGQEVRHEKTTPLRLPQREIDAIVESRPIVCSHHDAFRFFASEARPMNRLQPALETRLQHEQPGCVHANMDLYKWAAKSMPWAGSALLFDCFTLAVELRDLDMRASPYDLTAWGCEPICIETPEGRRRYESEQRRLAEKAAPLRRRLIDCLELTLAPAENPA